MYLLVVLNLFVIRVGLEEVLINKRFSGTLLPQILWLPNRFFLNASFLVHCNFRVAVKDLKLWAQFLLI